MLECELIFINLNIDIITIWIILNEFNEIKKMLLSGLSCNKKD
jgi:hypothetical protein